MVLKNKNKETDYEKFHKNPSIQTYIITRNNFTYKIILEIIDKYLNSTKKILDIGCGVGTLSLYLANKGNSVDGIDISNNAIKACKDSANILKLNKNTNFRVMKFPEQIPNKKFDFILFIEVIEHLENDQLALKKIFTLLKKGGIVILSTPSRNAPLYKLGLASKFDKEVGHLRRYTVDELESKCKKVGFEVIEIKKTEGLVRNFLYLNPLAGRFIRFIKFFMVDVVLFIDTISLNLFGESDIFLILRRPL